jgi:hypothetical protein
MSQCLEEHHEQGLFDVCCAPYLMFGLFATQVRSRVNATSVDDQFAHPI